MAGNISPIGFRELMQLQQQGVAQQNIKFQNVSLQSPKYVCIREEEKKQVLVVDIASKVPMRLPVAVDSAIMNPISKVLALRAEKANGAGFTTDLQIYNLEMKTKMKATQLPDKVVYWKWLDPKTISIVTQTGVFHWSMDGDQQPQQMFSRAEYHTQVQVINYQTSADNKWLILGGIAAAPGSPTGIAGVLQVYSVDRQKSQPTMDAHAACFAHVTIDGRQAPSHLFCFTSLAAVGPHKLHVIEVGVPAENAFKQSANLELSPGDFPVSMLADNKHNVLFLVTKKGFLFMFEIQSGKKIFGEKASQATMFTTCAHDGEESGLVAVDSNGRVSHFFVDKNNIVSYICKNLNDYDLGVQMAKRSNLPGAGDIFQQQFLRMMQAQRYPEAIELAASSPQGILRNIDTINALRPINQGSVLLQYFQLLLERTGLNAIESIELARPVVQRNPEQGIQRIQAWIGESKLEASEELGDLLKNHNLQLALNVYMRANVPEKVIGCFLALGAQEQNDAQANKYFSNILEFAKRANFHPDYPILVQQLIRVNRDRAKDFALLLIAVPEGSALDINRTVDTFMQGGDVKNTTNILLEYLTPRGDREEDAALQTRLLEINLLHKPQVADMIMESDDYQFTQYDKLQIARLCERAQLYQRALEHYTDLVDIKRVLSNTHMLKPEYLIDYFGRMTPENCLDCLRDLLKFNLQQNLRLVVEIAKKWSDYLTPQALIELFEEFNSFNGAYFYLGSFVNYTEDKQVVFKYIEAGLNLGQIKEVERVCKDNDHYDPQEVKELLLGRDDLKDPRPLIHVCDRYHMVDELTQYLHSKNLHVFIEAYVQRMNSKAAPKVVGTLLDLNSSEESIRKLLSSVRPPADMEDFTEQLVAQVEERNRLKILRTWLEERKDEGSTDPHVHNGLAKIYVDLNVNPAQFLTSNRFYDSLVVGKYCESRNPNLSFIAYKRAWGDCDDELIAVTNKNGFFKDQARYLVERQDAELWAKVLVEENEFRRQLIDQVVATALPESRVPEEVSTSVKAFMAANLPKELIELLERIILHGPQDGPFATNRNLQNLLILTAIKADKQRVKEYIKRLDTYDGPDIAKIAISEQYQLYEEAFFIYKKFKKGPECIQVLLENIQDMDRAKEFAVYWEQPDVWSILAKAQLDLGQVDDSIASFLKADDATHFEFVLNVAQDAGAFDPLISFIHMARKKVKDSGLDNKLIYCYAKTDRLADLEEFIGGSHCAKIKVVGEQCFQEELYHAAKLLFNHIDSKENLAMCYVKLEQFHEAVDAAKKANHIETWKTVCFACVDHEKFRLAQLCGVHLIVLQNNLMELITYYETRAHFEELISLLEQGLNLERTHQGIVTQLGIMYAKYKEDKLFEHIRMFWQRLNIPQLLAACAENLHWAESVFLYSQYEQHENAISIMIQHSAACWKHEQFKEILGHVANMETQYKAIDFYLAEHPLQLNDLLLDIVNNIDHTRVVNKIDAQGHIALIKKYMIHVQHDNLPAVNEALNKLYVEEENVKALRQSIDDFEQFDQISLAREIENHELIEFRRIAAHLYKINKRWDKSIELSKGDSVWGDAMETAAQSGDSKLAEELLRYFVDNEQRECFAACLFTCYELIAPDVVLELAWRNDLMNFAMPFMIQCLKEHTEKLQQLQDKLTAQDAKAKAVAEDAEKKNQNQPFNNPMAYQMPLGLPAPPGVMPMQPPMGGMGMPMQPPMGGMGMQMPMQQQSPFM